MESASTFFAISLLFKTLTATAAATFCLAVYRHDLSEYGVISLASYDSVDGNIFLNRVTEVPFYVITGVVGGLLGAAFNMTWRRMQMGRKRFFESKNLSLRAQIIWKLSEVGALSAFTSILLFTIPLLTSWSCKAPMATLQVEEGSGFDFNHRFDCPPAQVNELGIIFFGSRVAAIKSILAHPEAYDPRTLLTVGLCFFSAHDIDIWCVASYRNIYVNRLSRRRPWWLCWYRV